MLGASVKCTALLAAVGEKLREREWRCRGRGQGRMARKQRRGDSLGSSGTGAALRPPVLP